ncbi:MAG: aryl-sulfate sulfotransferase, partial [Halobaculum sp.]
GARGGQKTPARLIAYGPRGEILWTFDASDRLGVVWSYDVDPLGNGNLFVTATRPGRTLLYELDTRTGDVVRTQVLPYTDTHDADPLNRTHVVIANMRNYNATSGENEDRVVVYDLRNDTVDWEWQFDDQSRYDRSNGGNYEEDWTHVNDVDRVGDDQFLVSPRNFDQVLLINRTTGEIDLRLGSDDRTDRLFEQHNPDYLESDDGNPTFLVADSENDRVVEYAHRGGEWVRTWTLGDSSTLSWPRDADRLKNGHTLIADSRNHRVIEVAPTGEVVWEVYAPWLVYDVERIPVGGFAADGYRDQGGSRGPTMADLRATAGYTLSGAAPPEASALEACAETVRAHEGGFGSADFGNTATPSPTGTVSPTPTVTAGTPAPSPTATPSPTRPATVATPVRSPTPTPGSFVPVPGFGALVTLLALAVALAVTRLRN